jgi:hypothetical protein
VKSSNGEQRPNLLRVSIVRRRMCFMDRRQTAVKEVAFAQADGLRDRLKVSGSQVRREVTGLSPAPGDTQPAHLN